MIERFEKFSVAISEISRCWHKLASDEMKIYGLKGAHATYLAIIYRHPEGITVPELCELSMKDKSDASRMLGILEEKGLIKKEGKHKGAYGGVVLLTDEGKKAAQHVIERASKAVEFAGKDLTLEERMKFYEALELITENLRHLIQDGIPH